MQVHTLPGSCVTGSTKQGSGGKRDLTAVTVCGLVQTLGQSKHLPSVSYADLTNLNLLIFKIWVQRGFFLKLP